MRGVSHEAFPIFEALYWSTGSEGPVWPDRRPIVSVRTENLLRPAGLEPATKRL